MITPLTGQLAHIAARHNKVVCRLKIADDEDALQDYSDWFLGGSVSANLDQFCARATFNLVREDETGSLAPLMSPDLIWGKRFLTFEVAVVGTGETTPSGDWMMLFEGYADEPEWGGETLVIPARDRGALLMDTWVTTKAVYGDDGSPEAVEDVMQEILDDVFGTDVIPLTVVGSPSFTLKAFEQQQMPVAQALRSLAGLNGGDVRYLWDSSESEFRLTYYVPDRDKTTPDHTFDSGQYFDIPDMRVAVLSVRNYATMEWSGGTVTVEDATSQGDYGVLPVFFDGTEDPQLDTEEKVTAYLTAVVADLATPPVLMTAENALFPVTEITDLYRYTANDVHHPDDLDVAVTGYQHTFPEGGEPPTTTLSLRGKPSAGSLRWLEVSRRTTQTKKTVGWGGSAQYTIPSIAPQITITPTVDDSGNLSAQLSGNTATISMRVIGLGGAEPTAVNLYAETPIEAQYALPATVGTLDTLTEGETGYVWAVGYQFTGGGVPGPIAKSEITRPVTPESEAGLSIGVDIDADGVTSAFCNGNSDTLSWKVIAKVGSAPSDSEVRAASAIDGQTLTPADVGTLLTADPGDLVFIGAFGYTATSAGGTEGPRLTDSRQFGVTAAGVPDGEFTSEKLTNQGKSFSSTVKFTSPSNQALQWTSGTLTLRDGTSVSIGSGSVPSFTGTRYVYYNGTTTLASTTDPTVVQGDESYVLMCVAVAAASGQTAGVWPTIGSLLASGAPNLNASNFSVNSVDANSVQANAIGAVHIDTFTMEVGKSITSSNYSSGSAGWKIEDDDTEFNNITVRGTLDGVTGTFAGSLTATTTNAVNVNASGTITAGSTLFCVSLETTGSGGGSYTKIASATLGFYNATPATKQTVSGSRGSNAALASLLTALDTLGLITDSSS